MSERKIISINEAREKMPTKKRPSKWKIWLFVAIILVVAVVLTLIFLDEELNLDKVRRFFIYFTATDQEGYGQFSFDANSSNAYAAFDGGLAVATQSGVTTYAANGGEVGLSHAAMSVPAVTTAETFALAYDVGGDTIVAVDRGGKVCLDMKTEGMIFDLDTAQSGYFCYAMSGDPYKTVLVVYNTNQQEIYRWNSSTQYLNCCAVSNDGRYVAAVGLGQTDTAFASTALILRTDETEPYAQIPLGNQVIYDLRFLDNGNLCVVGEDSLQMLEVDGTVLAEFSYDGNTLSDFSIDGDGIGLSMYRNLDGSGYEVVTLDDQGQCLQRKTIDNNVLSISLCGKYLAVLTANEITIYNRQLKLYWSAIDIVTSSRALMRRDGTVILLGAGRGSLYIPD